MMHDELRLSIGAFLVGSLDDDESTELRAHLQGCDDCRAAYDEIAGLVGLLATVSAAEAESGPPQADDVMLGRLLGAVHQDRRRQRMRRIGTGVAAAVVAAAVAAGTVIIVDSADNDAVANPGITTPSGGTDETISGSDASTGIAADIGLHQVAWGTVLQLHLRGVEPGYACSLVAVASDGTREVTSSWTIPLAGSSTDGSLTIIGATGLQRSMISRFEIIETDGTMLLDVPA